MKNITIMRHFEPDMKDYNDLSYEEFVLYINGASDPGIDFKSYDFDGNELKVDAIYFSPYQRCVDTARIVRDRIKYRPILMKPNHRIRETSFNPLSISKEEWENLETWDEKRSLIINRWWESQEFKKCSLLLELFLSELKRSNKKNILVISHSFVLWILEYKIRREKLTKEIMLNSKSLWFGEMKNFELRETNG